MEQQPSRRGRWAFGLTMAAFGWGVALFVAAFVVPFYSSASGVSGHGGTTVSSSTLVAVNGLAVLVPVAIPGLLAGIVGCALHRKCTRGSRASGRLAWVLTWLLAIFSVLTGFSIGLFILPLAALLAAAVSLTPSGAHPGPVISAT